MVVADTTAWIEFFNDPDSDEKRAIDLLIDENELALAGPVLAELLQGCRTAGEAKTVLDHVSALPFLEASFSIWQKTGEVAYALRRKGITIPLMDLVIAVLAIEHDAEVYTTDPHFDKIPGLKLYRPK